MYQKNIAFFLPTWAGGGAERVVVNLLKGIEAIACSCPVVATDSPSEPQEILEAGKYGSLIPIGNSVALADAMIQTLEVPVSRDVLVERGMYFSNERATSEYLKLLL